VSVPLRVANCSGFYGDRLAAAREMVDGGPIDVLTGDWLAELTMLILAKNMLRDPAAGYARTFVTQLEQVMGDCLGRGIKVVSNAGGLSPRGCADAVASLAGQLGLAPVIAYVDGDDLVPRLDELRAAGVDLANLDTGEPLGDRAVMTANAYLGGWGIADALARGADIVITGRVTDAALTAGPAAWHHGWRRDDWDALAGAVVAGHVIECGAQVTGGNFAFFTEVPGLDHPGFPIAEVAADGSSVITKHPGHGGMVSVDTVTAQLLYEIGAPAYLNPDVTARLDSVQLSAEGPDRVRISAVRGDSPPATTKVALNYAGGWRSTITVFLTGLDIEAKADLIERALWAGVPGGRDAFDSVDIALLRTDKPDPATNAEAMAQLRITVKDTDEHVVGRAFTARITELALASYPGMFGAGLTSGPQAFGVYWPTVVPASLVRQQVTVAGGRSATVEPVLAPHPPVVANVAAAGPSAGDGAAAGRLAGGRAPDALTVLAPLGRVAGARSGDKGGNANLEMLKKLLPETGPLPVQRHELPNLRALNFVVAGLLGDGAAASTRLDPQAKSLGEWLRARIVEIPRELMPQ
jgi:Acyclic terpene utilisation family protein AtuA